MDSPNSAFLPCDLTHWNVIKTLLKDVALTKSTDHLISALQKVYDATHGNTSLGITQSASLSTRFKNKNVFLGLKTFLDKKASPEEFDEYFENILPKVLQMAVDIGNYADCVQYKSTLNHLEIKRELASSIVACAFLCILPVRSNERNLNLNKLFVVRDSDSDCTGLKAILQYFSVIARQTERPRGSVVFVKQKLVENVTASEIITTGIPLCPVTVSSGHLFRQRQCHLKQIVVGMGVFEGCKTCESQVRKACYQSELLEYPELIAGQVFFPPVDSNEVVAVHGLQPTYGTTMSFVDTLQTQGYQNSNVDTILREIITLECVFRQQASNFSCNGEQRSHRRDENESHNVPCVSRKTKLQTKSWRATSSFDSFNGSLSRGQSIDFDASSTTSSTTGDEMVPGVGGSVLPRRRSSALHSITSASSRRGSNVQRQLSVNSDSSLVELGVCHRRRSSGLSDVSLRSSSSSSGKRSSTDFSSEVDEYFENMQQHHSITAAVIEEENGGLNDVVTASHVDVLSGDVGKVSAEFARRNVERQMNHQPLHHELNGHAVYENRAPPDTSGFTPPGQNLLEHFVDNLINEAAQDSRLEIENHICRQQHPVQDWVHVEESCEAGFHPSAIDNCSSLIIEQNNCDSYADCISVSIMSSALQAIRINSQVSEISEDVPAGFSQPVQNTCVCDNQCRSLSDSSNLDCFATLFANIVCEEVLETYRQAINGANSHLSSSLPIHMVLSDKPPKMKKASRRVSRKKKRRNNLETDRDSNETRPLSEQSLHSSRFKDTVLSDFEEELIRSNTGRPYLLFFSDGKRRASEPMVSNDSPNTMRRRNRQSASVSLCESSDLRRHLSDRPLNRDISGSIRFKRDVSSSSDIVDLGNYAQKLVSDAFCDALREVCRFSSPLHSDDIGNLSQYIVERALFEASDVITSTSGNEKCPENCSDFDLHWVATDFAQQIINEVTQTYAERCVQNPVAGGISGQWSLHGGNQQLVVVTQWIAASVACIPHFHFFTSGIETLTQMNQVIQIVRDRGLTVSGLIKEVLRWRESSYDPISLFDFLILRLK